MILPMLSRAARIVAPIAALAALALPGAASNAQPPAQPQARDQQQCFFVRNINGFNAPNDKTLYIRVGVNDYWRIDLMFPCTGLTWKQGVGLESIAGNPWICEPIQAQIVFRDLGVRRLCPVSGLHKLSPAEYDALPRKYRP